MSNEELRARFERHLDAVLHDKASLAMSIQQNTATESVAMRCHDYVKGAEQFLDYGFSVPPAAPMSPERTKQEALAVVESYGASRPLRGITREDYCSLYPEKSFERATLETFSDFLQFLKATGVNP